MRLLDLAGFHMQVAAGGTVQVCVGGGEGRVWYPVKSVTV